MPPLQYPDPPLAGGGIVLRPWADADLRPAWEATQDPAILAFTHVPDGQTLAELRVFVHGLDQAAARGEELGFVIAEAGAGGGGAGGSASDAGSGSPNGGRGSASGKLLGSASLLRIDWDDARAEVGYWVAPQARGRGAAPAAARLIADWALAALPLERIELRIDADNTASLSVARAAGFTEEGTLRSYESRKGKRPDVVVWSRLASDR